MVTNKPRIPGVAYPVPKTGETFYVDFFWASLLNNRAKLNQLLSLEGGPLSEEFARLSKLPLARKTYSFAAYCIQHDSTAGKKDQTGFIRRMIDWYYHVLSPLTVEWQLNHPRANRCIALLLEMMLDVILAVFRIPLLDDDGIYRTKSKLPAYKDMTNYTIYERHYITGKR